jgi:ParB family chromosome partitioning protein
MNVSELSIDEATILMVESNFQQDELLPSEKAAAFKMRLDAMRRQGARTDLTCGQVVHKSRDEIAVNESGRQVQRFIRLTEREINNGRNIR